MKHKTCKHSVFNELWGEYKCKKKECALYSNTECDNCEHYEPKKKEK